MPKSKTTVRIRKNVPPLNNSYKYKFDELKKPGHTFEVTGKDVNYASIRAQASKQGKRRGVRYQVSKTDKGVIVRLDRYLPPRLQTDPLVA